jgi:hypothetical protein
MMTFNEACHNDILVYRLVREGVPLGSIIGAMASRHVEMIERIIELDSIAPKKIILPDGTIRIWRCPEELIPASKTINT